MPDTDDAGISCEFYKDWIKHPSRDSYWGAINSDSPEARENQWLLIAPIDHELTPMDTHRIGKIDIGKEA